MITKLFITLDRENYSLSFDVSYVNITVIALEQRATAQKTLCQQLSILNTLIPNTQHSGHKGNIFQSELMVEICSESVVRAIGKGVLMKFSSNTN